MTPEHRERLQFELKTIQEMGFSDYFLIVADFIALRASRNGSASGRAAARPPAASSRTASRSPTSTRSATASSSSGCSTPAASRCPTWTSTSPSRAASASSTTSREKYGRDRVAQIITFGTMAARAAVRDAGRVLDHPYGVVDRIAKLIPEGPGQTLDDCLKPGAELKQAYDADPIAKEIVDLAKPLEGLTRAGRHPRRRRRDRRRAAHEPRPAPAEGRRPGNRHAVLDGTTIE